jgi:glutamate-1-semialdehyde aminotransferase
MKIKKVNLWNRAKKVILGGNMLLSKRPEMFLPEFWPTYYSKSKGLNVWDLKGNKYCDMIFAVGTNTLGYCNGFVDRAVHECVNRGNMTTFNCPEEVMLAEKLIKIHHWAGMVKFARSGGEANAMSIRIARAASRKNNIAISGYHGWHDWYLSINLKNKNQLNKHLLKGLEPIGVPSVLKDTVHPFESNNFEKLYKIWKVFDVGTVKMEIARDNLPDVNFLKKVRDFCDDKKIILIFDECTSGFRRNLGGIHMTTGVYPDITILGKAMGNGYAINAVVGKEQYMKKSEKAFISSTFWTERIGYVAANSTIDYMKKNKTYEILIKNGEYIKKQWKNISNKYDLNIKISGIDSISSFSFNGKNHLLYKTFITQEMLKYNFLASNLIYLSILHTKNIVDKYIYYLDKIFYKIKLYETSGRNKSLLKGNICQSTFERVTK